MTETPGILWIGSARYDQPLRPSDTRKWAALSALPYRLHVIGFARGLRGMRFEQSASFTLIPALPLAPLRYLTFYLLAPLLAMRIVRRHAIDVLVVQGPYEGAVGALVKRLSRRPLKLIVESHGDFEGDFFRQRRLRFAGIYRPVMRTLARFTFRHADALRAVSESTRAQIQQHAPGRPVLLFMAWTDAEVFEQSARSLPLSESQEIVYAGALIPRKAADLLLLAFARIAADFPAAHLTLIGPEDDLNYTDLLRMTVALSGLEERVHFTGGIDQTAMALVFSRARALVLPSHSEGLGRVVIEAMLCGAPVIGSAVGGIPDMVKPGETGWLVPPGDIEALAGALRTALTEPEIEYYGQRAKAFAQGFFSAEKFVRGYAELIGLALRDQA